MALPLREGLIRVQEEEADESAAAYRHFAQQLHFFGQLPSTFAQIAATKALSDALLPALNCTPTLAKAALCAYVELLFLENSRPLHRGLLSTLSRLSKDMENLVADALCVCCLEYGEDGGIKHRRFSSVGVVTSVANLPQPGILKEAVQHCLNLLTLLACSDVAWVLECSNQGGRPPPMTMEDCQDAMGSLYYILQHYPHCFTQPGITPGSEETSNFFIHMAGSYKIPQQSQTWMELPRHTVYGIVFQTLIDVLQTSALSRDCVVAAGVGLCAAVQLQNTSEQVALLLEKSIFASPETQCVSTLSAETSANSVTVEASMAGVRSLSSQVSKFTEFGRLCVLRGLLTALPRPALNTPLLIKKDGICGIPGKEWKVWTILYDGVLPALCALCEGSVDSHFKFHTVTALQICMQQVRASVTGNLTQDALKRLDDARSAQGITICGYDPLSSTMISRVLHVVWNNWEDPLTQTVKQVQAVFDILVDVHFIFAQQRNTEKNENMEMSNGDFVKQIATNLLAEGRYRKGKYVPLASLATRIGALNLLSMNPNLLFDTFLAQSDDDVCCSASSFLKTFLERLKEDCWSSQGGVMEGELAFRRLWIPPLLSVLLSGNARLRSNLNTYALPVAIRIDPDSVIPIVAFILDGAGRYQDRGSLKWDELNGVPGLPSPLSMHQRIAALISVLKVARSLALIDGDIEENLNARMSSPRTVIGDKLSSLAETVVVRVQNEAVQIPVLWLEQALTHLDDSLRVDAAELICLNPKTATMPSTLELQMLLISIPLNMRCSSTFFRMRWTSLLKKFFQRVRTAAWRQHRLKLDSQSVSLSSSAVSYGDDKKKKRAVQTRGQKDVDNNSEFEGNEDNDQLLQSGVTIFKMQEFMQLLSQYLLSSLYPSAPYERKNMAMELLNAIFEVWSLSPEINPSGMTCPVANDFSPYQAGLLSTEATLVIVGAIVDSWDKLRESAFRILVRYPTPLPGLESKISIERIIHWAKGLVCSPRVRESDAGALVLRLIFRKYVLDLGWTIDVHSVAVDTHLGSKSTGQGLDRVGLAIAEYMESLNEWLEWGIEEGDRDLVKACSHSFVHGMLLTLRYTMEELPWTSLEVQLASSQLMAALHKLISLLLCVTSLSLWVVSANALNLPRDMAADSQAGGFDDILAVNVDDDNFEGDGVAPVEQMIMVGCWLSMKEVSLLLGTIAREVPLSGGSAEVDNGSPAVAEGAKGLLNTEQLEAMGEHFLEVLLAMKHNGAIDKTRAGFIALCDRLLRSSDPRLNKLPETWMKQLLERTGAKGQTVDNLLRRSAGIPAAFLALFLAEPDGAPKKLLPMAMRWLIDTSNKFVCASKKATSETAHLKKSAPEDLVFFVKTGENLGNQEKMKERDEGVVPTVHAFNAMRVAFHDTNLATDTSGFCAEGLITTIQAFSCSHWEVRNSATLAFTALVHRMIGFLNVYKRESARRAITGFEFFHRFPSLHPFLLEELRSATLQLQRDESNRGYRGHGMASTLHPSLGPVLIILSRLKPSVISSGVGDWLSPSAFRSYVSSCATQANLHVRVLASRALAPLVSSEDLPKVLLELAQSLPSSPGPKHVLSYNEVHGVLLQMAVLLTSNCITLPDLDMRSGIVIQLMTMLEQRWWLGSIQHCNCYIVVGAFISMLQGMISLIESCSQVGPMNAVMSKIQRHLLQLCSECLEDDTDDGKRRAESMQVTLKEQAAKLYFSTALTAWSSQSKVLPMAWVSKQNVDSNSASEITTSDKEFLVKDLGHMFRRALTHQMYEVRLATLKVLKEFSSSTSPTKEGIEWVSSCLQSLLVERLDVETHPGCIRRILLVFFAWRALPQKQSLEVRVQGQMGGNMIGWDASSLVMWDRILHIYRTSKHTKTKEVAMRCMGACLNQMRDHVCHAIEGNSGSIGLVDFTNWEHMKGAVDDWIDLVNKHSAASESINFRRATAEAVVASGLLEQVSWVASRIRTDLNEGRYETGMAQWYGKSLLQLWCVCVKLLEDEDSELRQSLALSLQEVLVRSFRTEGSAYADSAVPSQVEHVVQLVFQCLSEYFGTWKEYWEVLAEWVLGFEDIAALLLHDVDLVRRLFDKEIDNHHEEELIFVQLCCRHLRQLVCYNSKSSSSETQVWISERGSSSGNSEGQVEFLTAWRERFLEQAKLCAELTVCMQGKMSWVGGVTNHQDAFKMVYRRLLGLLTFAGPCSDNQKVHVRSQILEISRLLQQLPLNPLVSNLMYKVLQAYEKHMGIDLCSSAYRLRMGLAFCDKFEPLFLIE